MYISLGQAAMLIKKTFNRKVHTYSITNVCYLFFHQTFPPETLILLLQNGLRVDDFVKSVHRWCIRQWLLTGSAWYRPVLLTYSEMHLPSRNLQSDISTKKFFWLPICKLIFLEDFILDVNVRLAKKCYSKLCSYAKMPDIFHRVLIYTGSAVGAWSIVAFSCRSIGTKHSRNHFFMFNPSNA
jgi:hypothetical protein